MRVHVSQGDAGTRGCFREQVRYTGAWTLETPGPGISHSILAELPLGVNRTTKKLP